MRLIYHCNIGWLTLYSRKEVFGVIRTAHKQGVAVDYGDWDYIMRSDDGLLKLTDFAYMLSLPILVPEMMQVLRDQGEESDWAAEQVFQSRASLARNG
jgi:hypothetical protein